MLNFIFNIGLLNMLGGRWDNIAPNSFEGRLWFRCLLPGALAGIVALDHGGVMAGFVWLGVSAGSAIWFPWGWSFDEITGKYDPTKYPHWVQRIGLRFFPADELERTNRARGMLMKGIRGGFDMMTYIILFPINPWAPVIGLCSFAMGFVYWACGRIVPEERGPVTLAEFIWGLCRGAMIAAIIA